jgi:hypothetical protein
MWPAVADDPTLAASTGVYGSGAESAAGDVAGYALAGDAFGAELSAADPARVLPGDLLGLAVAATAIATAPSDRRSSRSARTEQNRLAIRPEA